MTQHVQSLNVAVLLLPFPTEGKKNSSSLAAEAGESDPWHAFLVVSAKSKKYRLTIILVFTKIQDSHNKGSILFYKHYNFEANIPIKLEGDPLMLVISF